jgi:hypothetical protein
MKTRRRKTTKPKHRKEPTAARRRRASSTVNLQRQLDERTRELAEAQQYLADALERQMSSRNGAFSKRRPVFLVLDGGSVLVDDLMRDTRFAWRGKLRRIRLDPADLPFAIWRIAPARGG